MNKKYSDKVGKVLNYIVENNIIHKRTVYNNLHYCTLMYTCTEQSVTIHSILRLWVFN